MRRLSPIRIAMALTYTVSLVIVLLDLYVWRL